jgi:hypothetical protein
MSGINGPALLVSYGENNNTVFNANSSIYMADVSTDDAMALHIRGNIFALGEDNSTLSNFVEDCYAQPIDLTINKSAISGAVAYQSSFNTFDEFGVTNLVSATTVPWVKDMNNTLQSVWQTPVTSFDKTMLGSIQINQNLNFDRNVTLVMNPEELTFSTFDANCTNQVNCTFSADLTTKTTNGYRDLNRTDIPNTRMTLKHYYGRTHASKQRYQGNAGNANIYFEIYCFGTVGGNVCQKALLPNGINSKRINDIRWSMNEEHNITNDGSVSIVLQKGGANAVADKVDATDNPLGNPSITTLGYDGSSGYPYKTTMQNGASPWLIYNESDPTATRNEFQVEFDSVSGWSGAHETNTTTINNLGTSTNRRVIW